MKILLDTHALLWWVGGDARLSARASRAIQDQDNTIYVSAASAWEIAIKSSAGKLQAGPLLANFQGEMENEGFTELPVSATHAIRAGTLSGSHKDPFDRMLLAQAQAENLTIISKDNWFAKCTVRCIW